MTRYLQDLQQRKEILLQPILEKPNDKMLVCDPGMKKRLITEISVHHTQLGQRRITQWRTPTSVFVPAPHHRSTNQQLLSQLLTSPLSHHLYPLGHLSMAPPPPLPFSAMPFNTSNPLMLYSGELCTMSVSALSLSLSVPEARMFLRKA